MDADGIELALRRRGLPMPVPPGENWIAPAYGDFSIANIPATVAALWGIDLPGALPPLPSAAWHAWRHGLRRVVLVILDGLGYNLFRRRLGSGDGRLLSDLAAKGTLLPLTSVFPSTTAAALLSLQTGVAPATHGWLAWEMYLREIGAAANGILLCPIWSRQRDLLLEWGLKPELLVQTPTLAMRLGDAGVRAVALTSRQFERSGYTQMLYRGMGQIWGHTHASDFWTRLREIIRETADHRAFISAYWSGLDTIGHGYGPGSQQWQAEFRTVCHLLDEEFLARLSPAEREGTLLLITADHGQLHVPPGRAVLADEDAFLSRNLMVPVVGESRAAFLHPRPGRATAIRDHIEASFPGRFQVWGSRDALDAGLMGSPACDEAYSRAGELLALGLADNVLMRARIGNSLLGRHGGLSADEMLVPFLAARLDAM